MAIAALVLGIVAVCGCFIPGIGWVGSVCGVLAIILGALGKKDAENAGKAKAGIVLGIISLTLGIIVTVACVACVGAGAGLLSGLNY